MRVLTALILAAVITFPFAAEARRRSKKSGDIKTDNWNWAAEMKKVAKNYKGEKGKVVPLGDSITYANQASVWAMRGEGRKSKEKAICKWMNADKQDKSNGWWLASNDQPSGRSWTAASGITSGEYLKGGKCGMPSLDGILKEHNPQVALILLGTNDLRAKVPKKDYLKNMETIYEKCLENGTIPVVQSVPPTNWADEKDVLDYNEGLYKLAKKMKLPFVDVYGEFVSRQPGGAWLGTLISKDGAHPTGELAVGPANDDNLKKCGHLLRCWLLVNKVIEVKKKAL